MYFFKFSHNDWCFAVNFLDVQPPRVDKCISPPPFIRRNGEVSVMWEEPIFSDNSRDAIIVTKTHESGNFPVGYTKIIYTATDKSRNNSTCTIDIIVKGI